MIRSVQVPLYLCSWFPRHFLGLPMSFLRPLAGLIGIFHVLLRVLVSRQVIFFPVMRCGCAVRVRRKLVEFGSALVRFIWHGQLLSISRASRGTIRCAALCRGRCPEMPVTMPLQEPGSAAALSPWHRTAAGTCSASKKTTYLRNCLATVQK